MRELDTQDVLSWQQLLEWGKEVLRQAEIMDHALDAWYLLEHISGMSRAAFLLRMKEKPDQDGVSLYRTLIGKRAVHIPLQHLTGIQEFMGLEFLVGSNVLIPRQDTELLVESLLPETEGKHILDLCTGSGCIAVSLAVLGKPAGVDAADISPEALDIARENADRNQASVRLIQSNLFEKISGCYDIVVSNPPYIETAVIDTLMPEVRRHEPILALDGGRDGLEFYRKIVCGGKRFLKPGGVLGLEIGYNQRKAVSALLKDHGYQEIRCMKDLAGLDRVILARFVL